MMQDISIYSVTENTYKKGVDIVVGMVYGDSPAWRGKIKWCNFGRKPIG